MMTKSLLRLMIMGLLTNLMFGQVTAQGSTLLMVSHDPRLADRFDRVVRMTDIVTVDRQAA